MLKSEAISDLSHHSRVGSFRQLTSTRSEMHANIEMRQIQTLVLKSEAISDSSHHTRVGADINKEREKDKCIHLTRTEKKAIQHINTDRERTILKKGKSGVQIRSHQWLVTPPEGGSFRQLTSTRSEIYANIESRQNANSSVIIRSHRRLITPPESGSFRQLTSTRREKYT